jgi:dihydrofolate synthase/folylpolyglutamate synthase
MSEKIDIAVVEVGIGGTNDVTNYFEPTIAAVSNVDFDHCAILGNTLEEIGLQKAGIFRANKPALYGATNPPQSLIQHAKANNAQFTCFGQDFGFKRHEYGWDFYSPQLNLYSLPFPSMRGQEQLLNASLAIAILANLKYDFPLTSSQIKTGLLQTSLMGRFQVMPGLPQIILDTAHNIQAVEVMWQNVLKLQFAKHNYALFAIANDKNWQVIIEQQAKNYDHWFLSRLGSERSADPEDILQTLLDCGVDSTKISISENITDAFLSAYNQLKQEDRLVCFGSFLTVEQAHIALHKVRK